MNPTDERLRKYCRDYPSLISRMTVNWMVPWPDDAFVSVAENVLRDVRISLEQNLLKKKNCRKKILTFKLML